MKINEIKNKTKEELNKLLASQRESLRELRFKDKNKQLKNIREIRLVKKIAARVLTVLNSNKKKD